MATNNACDYSPAQYNVQLGGENGTLTNVPPSSTSGIPLISQGATSNPNFGTTVVAGGGTGAITLTGVLIGNGTSAVTGNPITEFDILVAGASNTISSIGPGSSGQILQSGGAAANPAYSTATYPATTTINQLLYSSANNLISGLATADNGVITTGTSGTPIVTALASNGQLIIGSGSGAPAAATLSAGTGISITNGANSITISTSAGGFNWSDNSGTFTAAKQNGYFITATSTATLPASPNEGDTIAFIVDTTQILTITANTGQMIRVGSAISAAGGTCSNNSRGDSIQIVYRSSDTTWFALNAPQGTWTVT